MNTAHLQTLVAAEASSEWKKNIEEPPGLNWERIDDYIKEGLGWMKWIRSGTWLTKYRKNRTFEWCGAFAAYCYSQVGLKRKVRKKHLASTYRLWRWSGKHRPNERRLDPLDLRPGDICVVGDKKKWGTHICIVDWVSHASKLVHTIEGNAHGTLAKGNKGEGVVINSRKLSDVRYGVRPLREDYA